ncbi:MAG: response regulator [Deltaproteobacteria bacterium]|nr:response regulator [Deltaproteobacteria bacterium]
MATAIAPQAPLQPPRGAALGASAGTCEFALVLDRAAGTRLATAERLVLSLPALVGDPLLEVGLNLSASDTLTALVAASRDDAATRSRLAFWSARAGARCQVLSDLSSQERTSLRAALVRSPHAVTAEPGALAAEARRFFAAAGAASGVLDTGGLPVLELAVDGPEWAAVRWAPGPVELFLSSPLAPPVGDRLLLCVSLAGARLCGAARVKGIRTAEAAVPGAPPGLTLALESPPAELLLLLEQSATTSAADEGEKRRVHPRYEVRAPARVVPLDGGEVEGSDETELTGPDGAPRFLIENVSQGGAFLRTAEPFPLGALVQVAATLPTSDTLRCNAEVVFSGARGMGVRWQLDPLAEVELAAVVARIAARKRRALVVDDDATCRGLLTDALQGCGFEVLAAEDGVAGLQVLSEELLSLDLLLTDLRMPRMDGEALLRTVRHAGGESELAIVIMTGTIEPTVENKLTREGADAVLQKELGPRFLAHAAVAVLDRKKRRA